MSYRMTKSAVTWYDLMMRIDLTESEGAIFSRFSDTTRTYIRDAEESVTVRSFPLKHEKSDRLYVLALAFYKDFANIHRLKIPSFRESVTYLNEIRDSSFLLISYEKSSPIGAMWLTENDTEVGYVFSGLITRGVSLHTEYLLMWEAIKRAKALHKESFSFVTDFTHAFPQEKKTWKKLVHGFTDEEIPLDPEPQYLPIPFVSRRLSFSKLLAIRR